MAKKDAHLILTEEIYDKVKFLARIKGSSRSALVNDILIAFVERNEDNLKEFENAAQKINDKLKW